MKKPIIVQKDKGDETEEITIKVDEISNNELVAFDQKSIIKDEKQISNYTKGRA